MVNAVNNNRNIELVPSVLQNAPASASSAAVPEPRKPSEGVLGGLSARSSDDVADEQAKSMIANREANARRHVDIKNADMRADTTMSNANKTADVLKKAGGLH